MVKRAALQVACALALAAATGLPASAQALQRLTVQSFDLSSDTATPKAGLPFHLVVHLRVRERVAQIENIDLPILAQLDLLGDERQTTATPRGTEYRETITLVAHAGGSLAIAPATLQAIDARDGKAKQWYTNGLTLVVTGAPIRMNRGFVKLILWTLGALCVIVIAVLILRRRRPLAPPIAVAPAPPPSEPPRIVTRSRRQQAQDALAVLRTERTRGAAVAVRAAIWRMVGAADGETLGDVLRRYDANDPSMRQLLTALERSAFTYEADLSAAIDDACSALDRYIESVP
ncbi:MAG TPA: hypothetical protein VEW74_04530 [Candidatus Nitrosotalea sp.]|nr:hypothetical protein [Candidatus Nitrosotalea sp.]